MVCLTIYSPASLLRGTNKLICVDSTTPDVIPVTDTQSYIAEEWSSSSLDNDNSSTCEPQGEAMGEFDSDSDSDGGVSL